MLRDAVEVFTAHDAPRGCLIVLGAANCTVENRAVQDYLASLRQETLENITGRLRQAQEQGELSLELSVADLARFYAMVLHGLSLPARDGASREDLLQVVNLARATWPDAQKE